MIPLEQANAREMTRMEINHPIIMIARLRTARKSDESQNQDEDTRMVIYSKDFYLNTPMGQKEYLRQDKDKKEEESKNEEEEELNESGEYENCLNEELNESDDYKNGPKEELNESGDNENYPEEEFNDHDNQGQDNNHYHNNECRYQPQENYQN